MWRYRKLGPVQGQATNPPEIQGVFFAPASGRRFRFTFRNAFATHNRGAHAR
jgi:hypothetical protein